MGADFGTKTKVLKNLQTYNKITYTSRLGADVWKTTNLRFLKKTPKTKSLRIIVNSCVFWVTRVCTKKFGALPQGKTSHQQASEQFRWGRKAKKVRRSNIAADVRQKRFKDFWKSKIRKKIQVKNCQNQLGFQVFVAKRLKRRKPWTPWLKMCTKL